MHVVVCTVVPLAFSIINVAAGVEQSTSFVSVNEEATLKEGKAASQVPSYGEELLPPQQPDNSKGAEINKREMVSDFIIFNPEYACHLLNMRWT